MANVVGSATIRIIPDTSGFSASLQGQLNSLSGQLGRMGGRNITGNLSTQLNTLGTSLNRAGTRAALVGQAFTYGLTRPLIRAGEAIIGVAADFDEAARIVAAVTIPEMDASGAFETMDQFEIRVEEFKQSSRDMAKETVFSSTEVQKAYVDLGRAGLTTVSQIESVLPTIANVALVEGGEMADFSDKLVQIFTGFGGNFTEIGKEYKTIFGEIRATEEDLTAEFEQMGDVLTLTSQRTVTDITDLAVAFRYAGPTAKAAGVGFEEAAAALGLLAQAGFTASLGGTALRGIITRLAIPTLLSEKVFEKFGLTMEAAFQPENAAKLSDAMHDLGAAQEDIDEALAGGITGFKDAQEGIKGYEKAIFDSTGNMRPLVEIVEEFVNKGARVGDIGKVFGQRAGPAFQGLMDNLPALKRLTEDLDGATGSLDRMSARIKTSASVQFKLLKNSLTELAISFGEAGVLRFFADAAADLRDFVMELATTNPQVLKLAGGLAVLVAAIGPLGILFGLMEQALGNWFKILAFGLTRWGALLLGIGALAATLGVLAAKSEGLRDTLGNLADAVMRVIGPLKELFIAVFGPSVDAAGAKIDGLSVRLSKFFNDLAISINEFVSGGGLRDAILSLIDTIEAFKNAWGTVADLFRKAQPGIQETFNQIEETARAAFSLLVEVMGEVWDGLFRLGEVAIPVLAAAFYVLWRAVLVGMGLLTGLFNVLKPLSDIISDVLGPALLALAQIFIVAKMAGFQFATVFTLLRTGFTNLATGEVFAAQGRIAAFTNTLRAMFAFLGQASGMAIGGVFSSITNALAGLVRVAAAVVQPFANALALIVGGVGRFFSFLDAQLRNGGITGMMSRYIIGPMTSALLGAVNKVRTVAGAIGGAIHDGLRRAFVFATQTILPLASRLASTIWSALGSAMSAAGGAVSAVSTAISNLLNRAFTSLTNLNSGAITAAIDRVLMSVRLNASAIGAVIGRALTQAMVTAQTFLQSAVSGLWNSLVTSAQTGVAKLKNFLTVSLPAAWHAAWISVKSTAASAMIAVIMNVQMAARMIKDAFLVGVNGILGAWTAMRGRLASIDIGGIFSRAALAIAGLPTAMRNAANQMMASGTSLGASMDSLWGRIKAGATSAFNTLKMIATTTASAVGAAFQIAGQMAIGFMQGMMIAEATDLKGKLSALIPVLISIGTTTAMVFTMIEGVLKVNPVFALMAAMQALVVLTATVFGKMNKEVKDLTDSIDGFRSAMEQATADDKFVAVLGEVESALDAIGTKTKGQTGFTTIQTNMENAGVSMGGFVKALGKGDAATERFLSKWRKGDIDRLIEGGFVRLDEVNGDIEMVDGATGHLIGTFDDMAAARKALGKEFDKRFDVKAIKSLIDDYKTGKVSLEGYRKALEELGVSEEEAEAVTEELTTEVLTLGGAYSELASNMNKFFDDLRSQIDGFDPVVQLRESQDDFIDSVEGMKGALQELAGEGGKLDFSLPGLTDNSEQAREMRDQMGGLAKAFQEQVFSLGAGATSADAYGLGIATLRQQFIELLQDQGATIDEATLLADTIINASGIKGLDYGDFEALGGQIAGVTAQADILNETLGAAEGRYLAELAVKYPKMNPEQLAGMLAMAGGPLALRNEELAALGIVGGLPEITAPGGVEISPDAVKGLPSHGIPSEVTVKITFSAIENMDAALAEISAFTDNVQAKIREVAFGVLGLVVGTVKATSVAIQTIAILPGMLSRVAIAAANILVVVGGVAAQTAIAFTGLASIVYESMSAMANSIIELFGSLTQYILFTFSALNHSVLQSIGSIASGFSIMASSAVATSIVVVSAINSIVYALLQIPLVMASVGTAIASGFSRPFNLIANAVWNPFAGFINSAASALGLGPLLPSGLSIPVLHTGGIVGDATGDSYSGSRSVTQDEMFALLQKGEGVMSRQMMSSMSAAQIAEFKKGNQRWWAVGGPYESGSGRAGASVGSGYSFSTSIPDYDKMNAFWEGGMKPLLGSVRSMFGGNIGANTSTGAMEGIGDATAEYTRGYTDRMTAEQRKYLVSLGLPADFDIQGALPAGFDLAQWRSFLGANKKSGSWPLIASYLNAAGVPFLVNSTLRPGDTGSYHASGRAIDFGAPGDANYDSPGLLRINHALAPLLGVLSELIYSGPGGINDSAYGAAVVAAHHNHVHAALRDGGIIQDLVYAMLGEDGPEVVIPLDDPARALSLARRSGLIKTLQSAQARSSAGAYTAPSRSAGPNGAIDAGYGDDGMLGGAGNTYHIHGISWDQARRKIENRDQAALRRRR